MKPVLSNGRGMSGALRVNVHTIPLLREGANLLFDSVFLKKAEWDMSWADASMQVHKVVYMKQIEHIHLTILGWKYPKIIIDHGGRFVPEQGSMRIRNGAEDMPCFLAPIRVNNGQSFCPWCGNQLIYVRGGVDWCKACCTDQTGPIPSEGSPLWVPLPHNQLTSWETYGEFVSYGHWHGS